jgi:hypothetical protein
MKRIACGVAILFLSGCAPAGVVVPEQAAAGLVQSVGTTTDSLLTAGSSTQLNSASVQLTEAQTNLTSDKTMASVLEAQRTARERIVTARLLKQMSLTYHDPLLGILSEWVAGGGDPDFAFKYALIQVNPVSQVNVIPSLARLPMVRKEQIHIGPIGRSLNSGKTPAGEKSQQSNAVGSQSRSALPNTSDNV